MNSIDLVKNIHLKWIWQHSFLDPGILCPLLCGHLSCDPSHCPRFCPGNTSNLRCIKQQEPNVSQWHFLIKMQSFRFPYSRNSPSSPDPLTWLNVFTLGEHLWGNQTRIINNWGTGNTGTHTLLLLLMCNCNCYLCSILLRCLHFARRWSCIVLVHSTSMSVSECECEWMGSTQLPVLGKSGNWNNAMLFHSLTHSLAHTCKSNDFVGGA